MPYDDDDNPLPDGQEPEPWEFEQVESKPWRPLARAPRQSSLKPVIWWISGWLWLSAMYWRYPETWDFSVSRRGIFENYEFWRLVSALLVHSDIGHLLSNSYLFIIFGWLLRDYYGSLAFPWVSAIVGAMTNVIVVYYYPMDQRLVGASGMVFAMIGMWLVLYIRFETGVSFAKRIFFAIGFCLVLLVPSTYDPRTSYLAHGIGFVLGVVAGGLLIVTGAKVIADRESSKWLH